MHGQHGEHHRDIVHDRGQQADGDVGAGGAEVGVHDLRGDRQVAEETQAADTHHHAIEKQQRVPFGIGDTAEHIERNDIAHLALCLFAPRAMVVLGQLGQVKAKQLQIAETGQHADDRRQVEKVVERHGGDDSGEKQADNRQRAGAHLHRFGGAGGLQSGNRKLHQQCRHQEVHQGGYEQVEELPELDHAFLPDHQCGDVAERAEGAAGVGADDNIDAREQDEALVVAAHRKHHRTHQQGGRQVVRDRRNEKR